MKNLICAALLGASLLIGPSAFAQISVGVRIGPPPPPRVVRVLPARPSSEYMWVNGYWYPVGNHYKWHEGYWTRVPYAGAQWVAPRYDQNLYYIGYWEGSRGRFEHNHKWDHDKHRDNREHEKEHKHRK